MLDALVRVISWHRMGLRRTRGAKGKERKMVSLALGAALVASLPVLEGPVISHAAGLKVLSIGMDAPLTGAEPAASAPDI